MFGLFSKAKAEKRVVAMHNQLEKSFANVKQDTKVIFQWLSYFYQQNQALEQELTSVKTELKLVPRNAEDIKQIVDSYYSFDSLKRRLQDVQDRIDRLSANQERHAAKVAAQLEAVENRPLPQPERVVVSQPVPEVRPRPAKAQEEVGRVREIESRLEDLEEQRKATVREKVVKRVTRNSKEYIKSLILSYIRKYGNISGLQLKEMVVDDQGLCSKSSFYRILDEVEDLDDVGVVRKGKQKYYTHQVLPDL